MSLLEVKDLSIRFGGVHALKGVTFSIDDDTIVGLMGPNGAGKTTVINCLSAVYKAEKGRAFFEGNDILKLKSHQVTSSGISRTFQDLGFFNQIQDMSVLDYLKLGHLGASPGIVLRDGFRTRRSRAIEIELKRSSRKMLEFFRDLREKLEPPQEERGYPILFNRGGFPDLIDVEDASVASLSFAWRRRLDLMRALVSRPKLLLLDEPAQGLPPSEIENLGKILRHVQAEFKVAMLLVEHNVAMLMSTCSKIVAMDYGETVAEGTPQEINKNPKVNEIYLGIGDIVPAVSILEKEEVNSELSEPIVLINNIDLFYGQAQALSAVSLKLFPKQLASVLGTNGSGKSSLLKVISGMEKPVNGEILLHGEYLPLGWPEVAVERGIQYVPQGHVIFPRLTVRQNLKIGAYTFEKRGRPADIQRVFRYFPELENVLDLQANDLSGGQRQMVAIGQAIIGKPDVLLLDEPSLGLSPKFIDKLFEAIQRIRSEDGCSILLVEQNVTKALEISDYVFMMSSGILISEGSATSYRENLPLVKKNLGFL